MTKPLDLSEYEENLWDMAFYEGDQHGYRQLRDITSRYEQKLLEVIYDHYTEIGKAYVLGFNPLSPSINEQTFAFLVKNSNKFKLDLTLVIEALARIHGPECLLESRLQDIQDEDEAWILNQDEEEEYLAEEVYYNEPERA